MLWSAVIERQLQCMFHPYLFYFMCIGCYTNKEKRVYDGLLCMKDYFQLSNWVEERSSLTIEPCRHLNVRLQLKKADDVM